jgi:hypothetical protein
LEFTKLADFSQICYLSMPVDESQIVFKKSKILLSYVQESGIQAGLQGYPDRNAGITLQARSSLEERVRMQQIKTGR